MVSCRRVLPLLGFVGSLLLITLSIHQWHLSQEKKAKRIHQRQETRKELLRETCQVRGEVFSGGWDSLVDTRDERLSNLIVDDNHGIIYCYIPKVACTNWKRVMYVLNQSEPYVDPISVDIDMVHVPNIFHLLKNDPIVEIKAKLRHYTKFLFVRDPFVRVISGFRDKFLKHNQYFYENYGRNMLRLYGNQPDPPRSVDEAFSSGMKPSFNNFVQYLLDPQTERREPFEPHWRQMHRLCHPCFIRYDFVGHQETLQEDAQHLLQVLKLEGDIRFPPSYENMTAHDSVTDWFRTVPLEDRRKLYKLYEEDFRMFGYRRPSELLDEDTES